MALSDFFEKCVLLDRVTHAAQLEGIREEWVDGAELMLGVTCNNSNQAQLAYQAGAKVLYTVVMPLTVELQLNDRLRRVRDGVVLKLTSDPRDMTTPGAATVQFKQARAEAIRL